MAVKNKVQLITYPDSLGGDLKSLNKVALTKHKMVSHRMCRANHLKK